MFLYSAYADDTTFFVGDLDSASEIFKVFDTFSIYFGLKPNMKKMRNSRYWETERGVNSIDLAQETIKILGLHGFFKRRFKEM